MVEEWSNLNRRELLPVKQWRKGGQLPVGYRPNRLGEEAVTSPPPRAPAVLRGGLSAPLPRAPASRAPAGCGRHIPPAAPERIPPRGPCGHQAASPHRRRRRERGGGGDGPGAGPAGPGPGTGAGPSESHLKRGPEPAAAGGYRVAGPRGQAAGRAAGDERDGEAPLPAASRTVLGEKRGRGARGGGRAAAGRAVLKVSRRAGPSSSSATRKQSRLFKCDSVWKQKVSLVRESPPSRGGA
jgi:hypothetical protein